MTALIRKESWHTRRAVLMTQSPTVSGFVRDLVQQVGWKVAETTTSVEAALNLVRAGKVNLVILDDNIAEPVSYLLRRFISDPMGVLTPTMVLLLEQNKNEMEPLSRMGKPEVIMHPLAVGSFLPTLRKLLKRWESPLFETMRNAAQMVALGKAETGLRMLTQLTNADLPTSLPTQALAYFYRELREHKTAEKILLNSLQKSPSDIGCIFSLADLYLHTAMPLYAYRLLHGAATALSQSLVLLPDLVHTCVQLGRFSEAIEYLYRMHLVDYLGQSTHNFLVRLLLAEGREEEAGKLAGKRREMTQKLIAAWAEIDSPTLNAAAS